MNILILHLGRADTKPRLHNPAGKLKTETRRRWNLFSFRKALIWQRREGERRFFFFLFSFFPPSSLARSLACSLSDRLFRDSEGWNEIWYETQWGLMSTKKLKKKKKKSQSRHFGEQRSFLSGSKCCNFLWKKEWAGSYIRRVRLGNFRLKQTQEGVSFLDKRLRPHLRDSRGKRPFVNPHLREAS